jgi:molybdopterin-guanine dinucleotide biosynthesis protein A
MQTIAPCATGSNWIDKGLVAWDSLRMIDHVIARIRPQCSRLWLNRDSPVPDLDLPLIVDHISWRDQGPLAGLHAALHALQHEAPEAPVWLLTVPCDSPLLPHDLVQRLLAASHNHLACVARTDQGLQPIIGLWHRDLLGPLQHFLLGGERSAHRWVQTCRAAIVDFEGPAFLNINTPADLQKGPSQ